MATVEAPISPLKLMLVLLMFSTGVSVAIFVPSVSLAERAGYPPQAAVLPFSLLTLSAHYLLFRNWANRLEQIVVVLRQLYENRPVQEIEMSSNDVLKPLTDALNALIRERNDLSSGYPM